MKTYRDILEVFKHPQLGVIKRASLKQKTSWWYIHSVDDQDRVGGVIIGKKFKKRNDAKDAAEKAGLEVVRF